MILEDEADLVQPDPGEPVVVQSGDALPSEPVGTARRSVQTAEYAQERRLTGTGRAGDADELAGPDAQRDVPKGMDVVSLGAGERPMKGIDFDEGRTVSWILDARETATTSLTLRGLFRVRVRCRWANNASRSLLNILGSKPPSDSRNASRSSTLATHRTGTPEILLERRHSRHPVIGRRFLPVQCEHELVDGRVACRPLPLRRRRR